MSLEKAKEILSKLNVSIEDPKFYSSVFGSDIEESGIQEGCSIRNQLSVRSIVNSVIDEDSKIKEDVLKKTIENLEQNLYSIAPGYANDAKWQEHLLKCLKLFDSDKHLQRTLHRITRPYSHKYAEQMIRDTLHLSEKTVITDTHARRAGLAAWLCTLRQNVGSCFATAPAIIVHDEQPEQFFNDIYELLGTGRLKRTFGGVEYAVPMSTSWGAGDLNRIINKPLLNSPGLLAAFEACSIKSFTINEENTAEQIIRAVLLKHYDLSEKDIEEYENRPKGMIHGGFLMQTPGAAGGKGGKCERFEMDFEKAKNAFKAVADNALLKTWEYTLASFAEIKAQFTSWNLYSSLGLGPHDEGGIGPTLIEILQKKLNESNAKMQEHQIEYEQLLSQVQYLERRTQRSASDQEMQWNRAEYQSRLNEFKLQEELRNKYHTKAKRYAHLFDELIDLFYNLFPDYFQEVYDADIREYTADPYDDSPAGFRLLFKHGRSNTSQWTKITNPSEFVDSLSAFFTAIEPQLTNAPQMKGLEEDVSEIISEISTHIRTHTFLETAFFRIAKRHHAPLIQNPLENLDKIEKKPWVYTSGGSMQTLVSSYFKREEKPTELSRWVESPMELLVFFVDAVKEMSEESHQSFDKNKEKSVLVHSPTHAFLLKPGYAPFSESWKTKEFTYVWVRDNLIKKMLHFSKHLYLDDEKMAFVIEYLQSIIPQSHRIYFKEVVGGIKGSLNVSDFRGYLVDSLEAARGFKGIISSEDIDSALYSLLPLHPNYQLKEKVRLILSKIPDLSPQNQKDMLELLELYSGKIGAPKLISAQTLKHIVYSLIRLIKQSSTFPVDYVKLVSQICQSEEYAFPQPVIFADTNWMKDYFAFCINPGTLNLELWRMDYTGSYGFPMRIWDGWLNGSRKEPTWGIFTQIKEYSS